jgi:RND family efflux transporter MFP subunit
LSRLFLLTAVGAAIVLLMFWLLGRFHPKLGTAPEEGFQAIPVGNTPLVPVRKITVAETEVASGKVMPVHEADVASQILEKVVAVNVKAGQKVKKGDVLVRLDDAVLRSRLQQAQANLTANTASLKQATAEENRTRELATKGIVSQSDLDVAVTALRTAEAKVQGDEKAVAEAEATLRFATVTSPIDGVVIDKMVEVGDMAQPGKVLATIYDAMEVVANVRESHIDLVKEGQSLEVRIDHPALVCRGTVREIVPQGDPTARTFPVKVVGPCQPGVHKGMYAKVIIPVGQEELLVIPPSAVVRIGQLETVEVAEGKHLRRRTVQLGRTLTVEGHEQVQVLSGLGEGDLIAERPVVPPTP